jgi:hypothetical protein
MRSFMQQYVAYDVYTGRAHQGTARTALTREQLYTLLGREDLIEQSERNRTKRIILFTAAGAALAAGIAGGIYVYGRQPDLNSRRCTDSVSEYNDECIPKRRQANIAAGGLVIGGLLAASGFIAWGLSYKLDILSPSATAQAVAQHNGDLMRTLRQGVAARKPSATLEVFPQVSYNSGGVGARVTF